MATAYVVHEIRGRLRLRVPEHRNDESFFEDLAKRLEQTASIDSVRCDALTGSVLIRHEMSLDELRATLEQDPFLSIAEAPPRAARYGLSAISGTIDQADSALRRLTSGGTDLKALLFVVFIAMTIRQVMRGQIMVPAVSLLWYAFELVLHSRGNDGSA